MNERIIEAALSKYGEKEIPGTDDNNSILEMAKECGFTMYAHDSISWCSLFAACVAMKAGCTRSESLMARSWLKIGLGTDEPEIGDVVVLWRDAINSPFGHVGFFIRFKDDRVFILGGNQSDQVNIAAYPKLQVLGYRQLEKIVKVPIHEIHHHVPVPPSAVK